MKKITQAAIFSVLLSLNSYSLTLEEALTSAYNNNQQLKIAREGFLQSIEQYPQIFSEFMPRIKARLEMSKSKSDKKVNPESFLNSSNKTKDTTNGKSISLEQSLFSGGGSAAGLKAAELAYKAAKFELEANEQKIMNDGVDKYLSVIESQEIHENSSKSVNFNSKLLQSVHEKFKLGESTKTEIAQAKAALARSKAEQSISYANLQSAKANFKNFFGIEPKDLKAPSGPSNLPSSFDVFLNTALKNNPLILSSNFGSEAQKYQTYRAKSELLPSADLSLTGRDRRSKDKTRGRDGNTRTNVKNVEGTIGLNIPILSKGGAEYSRIRQQKSKERETAIRGGQQIEAITSGSVSAWERHVSSKERLIQSREAVESTNIALEGLKQEEALGQKTILDVLKAEAELSQARNDAAKSKKENIEAAYSIKYVLGELGAKNLKLKVKFFEPEKEFANIKYKMIGF